MGMKKLDIVYKGGGNFFIILSIAFITYSY